MRTHRHRRHHHHVHWRRVIDARTHVAVHEEHAREGGVLLCAGRVLPPTRVGPGRSLVVGVIISGMCPLAEWSDNSTDDSHYFQSPFMIA